MEMGATEDRREGAATLTEMAPVGVVGFVYLVTNLVNGKEYVGQTKSSLEHRWAQHVLKARTSRSALRRRRMAARKEAAA